MRSLAQKISGLDQAIILVGGKGTRLGSLTSNLPKPLLEVGGAPFLDYLIESCMRFGFSEIVLLAGYNAELIARYVENKRQELPKGVIISLCVEPAPCGTAGALKRASHRLADKFLLLNGDSFFDINWLDLILRLESDKTMIVMALVRKVDASRFGTVTLEAGEVKEFTDRGNGPGLINAGVYLLDKRTVADFPESGSLESSVLPRLAANGLLRGTVYDGYFVDIGVPCAFAQAQVSLPARRERTAVVFDRNGTVVIENCAQEKVEIVRPEAYDVIKRVNDQGYFSFLITDTSDEEERSVKMVNQEIQRELRSKGAHFDDVSLSYSSANHMLNQTGEQCLYALERLIASWPLRRRNSVVISDKVTTVVAANQLGLQGRLYAGEDLASLLPDEGESGGVTSGAD